MIKIIKRLSFYIALISSSIIAMEPSADYQRLKQQFERISGSTIEQKQLRTSPDPIEVETQKIESELRNIEFTIQQRQRRMQRELARTDDLKRQSLEDQYAQWLENMQVRKQELTEKLNFLKK